ncbi:MAG: tyrosine--tRNA ligase [Candidatus Magasanikbacteria bacterium]|nr:tyrosine--tRNA ligase [Candidatus Magasanikbacteria bacterium]
MKVSPDAKKIEELLTRGVEHVYPAKEFLEKELKSGRQLTLYTGYDPTAPTLHIGHGITLLKLKQFQELGHKVIMLIGDFTAMIGDPTDKTAARQQLNREQALKNSRLYRKQAGAILDFSGQVGGEIVKYNSEWLDKLSLREFVQNIAPHFTTQQLMARDMFELRLKEDKPIFIHEFIYPLLQAFDSVAMDVDGEVGGNDQTFNMLVGRDLMKDLKQQEKFVVSMKLLTDPSGQKMGKTEGNMVAFSDTPEDMFGKVMRWTDEMIALSFELCTRVSMAEISQIKKAMAQGANPRDFKLRLAYEITKTFLGESAAKSGQAYFASVIQKDELPADIPAVKPSAYDIVTVLAESKLVASKSDARRAVEQGGVKLNDKKVVNEKQAVKSGDVIQKGKRWFVRVK